MNNETDNNVNTMNNGGNSSGTNFGQGNVPVNNVPLGNSNVINNGLNQIPQAGGIVMGQNPANGVQEANTQVSNTTLQKGQVPINFVSGPVVQEEVPVVNQASDANMTGVNNSSPSVMPQQIQTPNVSGQNFGQPVMQNGMQSQTFQQPVMQEQILQQPVVSNQDTLMSGNYVNSPNGSNLSDSGKQKSPIVLIIITILVVVGVTVFLILFLTGKISFGTSSAGNQGTGNDQENGSTEVSDVPETLELADWMNYLLEQNITDIKINRYTNSDELANPTVVTLTSTQLEDIFQRMTDYNLVKYYSSGRGTSISDELQITYVVNNNSLKFSVSGGRITFDTNGNLLELFENSEHTIQDDGVTSRESDDYNYILEDFDSDFYDEYFGLSNEENVENNEE